MKMNNDEPSLQEINISQNLIQNSNIKKNKEADYLHSQGWEARKKMDFKRAIDLYSKAIEIDPQHFKAYLNRGFAYDKIGETDKAIADYTRAVAIEPRNAYCYYNRGISLNRKNLS